MSYLKIDNIESEISLTESELNSIVGGRRSSRRLNKSRQVRPEVEIENNYVPQSILSVSQGNNGFVFNDGSGDGQYNSVSFNIQF